jgi:hypothetical protein
MAAGFEVSENVDPAPLVAWEFDTKKQFKLALARDSRRLLDWGHPIGERKGTEDHSLIAKVFGGGIAKVFPRSADPSSVSLVIQSTRALVSRSPATPAGRTIVSTIDGSNRSMNSRSSETASA